MVTPVEVIFRQSLEEPSAPGAKLRRSGPTCGLQFKRGLGFNPSGLGISSTKRMEILLNLVWLLLGIGLLSQWCRFASRPSGDRDIMPPHTRMALQLLALGLVLVILFPVVSLSDDLVLAMQSPAETNCCVRKGSVSNAVPSMLATAAWLRPVQWIVSYATSMQMPSSDSLAHFVQNPALRRVDNRPPPVV